MISRYIYILRLDLIHRATWRNLWSSVGCRLLEPLLPPPLVAVSQGRPDYSLRHLASGQTRFWKLPTTGRVDGPKVWSNTCQLYTAFQNILNIILNVFCTAVQTPQTWTCRCGLKLQHWFGAKWLARNWQNDWQLKLSEVCQLGHRRQPCQTFNPSRPAPTTFQNRPGRGLSLEAGAKAGASGAAGGRNFLRCLWLDGAPLLLQNLHIYYSLYIIASVG